MRFAVGGEGARDDASLKVSGVDGYIGLRGNHMAREALGIYTRRVRKIPEQIHSRAVQLHIVIRGCAGEGRAEIVSDVPAVDLDGPAVVIDAASRHGDYKGMRTEPGITRHLDV